MPDSLTQLYPRPQAVVLGSRTFLVHEARLSDLAELQAWIDARWVNPIDGLSDRVDGLPDGVERDRILFDAYAACDDGPPTYDSLDGTKLLATPEGFLLFLRVALRIDPDELTRHLLDDAMPTPEQFGRLRRTFFGSSDLREIRRLLKIPPHHRPGKSLTWGESIDSLARSHGWTYEHIGTLSLSAFVNARRQGVPENTDFQGNAHTLGVIAKRWQAAYGHLPEPTTEPDDEPLDDAEWHHPDAQEEGSD